MADGSKVRLRRAQAADVPTIVRMLADDRLGSTREQLTDPLPQSYYDAFAAIDADPRQQLLVAEAGDAIIGCLQLTLIPGLSHQGAERAQIEAVRVAAAARGSGFGRAMIEQAIGIARARGCKMVQLTSDRSRTDAHRFYEGLGFKASHLGMKLDLR